MSDQYPQNPPTGEQPAYGTEPHPTQAYPTQGYPTQGYQTQPSTMSAEDERTWGAISHAGAVIAMICSAGFLGFLASIAVYVIYKDRGPFVREHSRVALNFQLTVLIAYLVGGATSFLGIGLPPSTMSWGNDINAARTSLRVAPGPLFWPAAALSITVLSFLMMGDVVRDALDPKARARR